MTGSCPLNPADGLIGQASSHGLPNAILGLIKDGADVNFVRADGFTPLLLATWGGHLESVKVLIENGADVNFRNEENGATAFLMACQKGYFEMAKYLFEEGANIFAVENQNENAAELARFSKNKDLIDWLYSLGLK